MSGHVGPIRWPAASWTVIASAGQVSAASTRDRESQRTGIRGAGGGVGDGMTDKLRLTPGPDHPVTIEKNPRRVVVSVAGRVIADTTRALTLREATYPAVQYIPPADVDFGALERSDRVTYCPYKGDCSYYSITGDEPVADAVWTYEDAYPAVKEISGFLAFYRDKVRLIEQ
jgi:uncharacterized protein (DUF427 family)